MKTSWKKVAMGSVVLTTVFACNKNENAGRNADSAVVETAVVSDSISTAASTQVADKKFVKTADVDMEVKDVYDATIAIEKSLEQMGGFVTSSKLNSAVISEETFNTSDTDATLVRKFQTENTMQVRVPTERLSNFLQFVADKKLFLNSRSILADDVTSNMKLAELEAKRNAKSAENITKIKDDKDKVAISDNNMLEGNHQKISTYDLADKLKYSTVDIYLKEPKIRIAEIAVTNTKNIDNKYKTQFFFEMKNAFVNGFYLIQKIAIGLANLWPLLIVVSVVLYLRKKKRFSTFKKVATGEEK